MKIEKCSEIDHFHQWPTYQDRFSDLANLSRGSTIGQRRLTEGSHLCAKEWTTKLLTPKLCFAVYVRTCWSLRLCPGHFHHSTVLAWDSSRFLLCTRISSLRLCEFLRHKCCSLTTKIWPNFGFSIHCEIFWKMVTCQNMLTVQLQNWQFLALHLNFRGV